MRDRVTLRELRDRIIEHHGSASQAEVRLGLERRTFAALGKRPAIATKTLQVLEAALEEIDPELVSRLAECVMLPEGRRFYDRAYGGWCDERSERFILRRGESWHLDKGGKPQPVLGGVRARQAWRRLILSHLNSRIRSDPATKDLVLRYRRQMARMGIPEERQHVALVRAAEPLAEFINNGHLQRRWHELKPAERRQFVKRAYLNEIMLLKGEHPQVRAERFTRSAKASRVARQREPTGAR